jgi:Zn-dependent membrane protease YugP
MFFDFKYLLWTLPAVLLALWARSRMMRAYGEASQLQATLSGAAAARHILDEAGLQSVPIEPVEGQLTDHYDPREKVLRLSQDNYYGQSLSAVGIAAHEAGHAIQDATRYAPLVIRNAAVGIANIGSSGGMIILFLGAIMQSGPLVLIGLILFGAVAFFQLVNLPVEYDASARAKKLLVERRIVPQEEMPFINKVLNAAALTYVAATLESVLTLLYYASIFTGGNRDSDSDG